MKTTIAGCRVVKAAALFVLLAMAGERAAAVDPIPDWLTLVFPVAVPKAGHPSEIPTDRRANHIKALYDDMFEAYWRETSYHDYDPATGGTTHGLFVDSRTFNYIMMPWPIFPRGPVSLPAFPDGTTQDSFGGRRHSDVIFARAGDGSLVVPFAPDGADADDEWTSGESFRDANGNNQFDPYSYNRTYRPAEDRWNSDNNLAFVQYRDGTGAPLGTLFFPANRRVAPNNDDGYSATGGEMFADYNHNADLENDDVGYNPSVTIYYYDEVSGEQASKTLNELDLTPLDDASLLEGDLAHTAVVDAEPAVGPNPPNKPLGGAAPGDIARNGVLDYTTAVNDAAQIVRAIFTNGLEAYTEYQSFVRSDEEPDEDGFYRYENTWKGTGAPPVANTDPDAGPVEDWVYEVQTIRVNVYQAQELYGVNKFSTPTGNAYGDETGADRTQVEDNAWTPGQEVITEINGEPFEDFLSWYDPDLGGMTWLSELPPNYAPVITNATGTIIVNNPSPQIGNADDGGNWNLRGRPFAVDWLEYERYIRWNYPGDADALLARAFSGMYDGPEDYESKADNKLTPVPVEDVITMQPMSVAGADLLNPPNHWDDRFYPTWQDWWNDAFAADFGFFETDGLGAPILDPSGNPIPMYDRGGAAYTIDQDLITGYAIPILDGLGDPVYETDGDGNIGLDAFGQPIPLYQGIPDGNLVLDPLTFIAQRVTGLLPATAPLEWNETVYDATPFSPDDGPDENGWIPATSWGYSTTREFCDLPSTLYHLRDGVGAFVLGAGRDPLTGYLGGDEAFGEITSPFNTEIYGQDLWTATMDGGSRETQDGLITPASPFAYQINGVNGADAGNIATLEYMTWRRDGDPLVDVHPWEFRDRNLDGRIDTGYIRSGEAAYSSVKKRDGTGPYPFNRERFMEDVIAIWDYSEDFSAHTNRLTGARIPFYGFPNYLPQATTPVEGGAEGEEEVVPGWGALGGPAGANVDVMTLDDVTPYHIVFQVRPQDGGTIGGSAGIEIDAPDVAGSSFGMGILLHEQGHDILGWPDLYDYDVSSEGEVVNEPIGGYDLMAGGLVHGVGDLKWAAGWTSLTNLNVVVPVNTDPVWIDMYPAERYANNYFRFTNPVRPGEYLDLWYTQNSTRFGVPGGAGVYIAHMDKGANPLALPRQQRMGNHFIWQMVQADGLQQLEDNANGGDGGDPFPGSTGNKLFTEFTTPASRWHDGTATGLRIFDVILPTTFGEPARVLIGQYNPYLPFNADPNGPDADADGIPDAWEFHYFGRLDIVNATTDYDGDGLNDLNEYLAGMNPRLQDSDLNGTPDGMEDVDGDGLHNRREQEMGTHPRLWDTADNGLSDSDVSDADPLSALTPLVDRVLSLGGTGYVDAPERQDRRFALNAFTLQAWVRPTALGGAIIERQVRPGALNYALRVLPTGRVELRFTPANFTADIVLVAPAAKALALGEWAHVAGTFNAGTGRLSIYINGVQVATMTTTRRPVTLAEGPVWTRIGDGFDGLLDEAAFFNVAMSPAAISATMAGIGQSAPTGLVSYYRFDDGTSAAGPDLAGFQSGTSGRADWWWGQVEEFASGFTRDWLHDWRNAGTLRFDAAMVPADAEAPVHLSVEDTNGDGIPDWWYVDQGLDPAGPSVAGEDWDEDDLNNYWEAFFRLDPNNRDTDGNGISDLFDVAADPRYTDDLDMDGIADRYEASRTDILNPLVADGHLDHDNDDWSTEMEVLAALQADGTVAATPNPNNKTTAPAPALTLEIQYNRVVVGSPIVVVAYDNALMNGTQAVATFEIPAGQVTGVWPLRVTLNTPTGGRLAGRPLWFMAFLDLDGDGLINPDEEPLGFGERDPVQPGFLTVGPVRITLTDQGPPGFSRIATPEDLAGLVNPRFVVRRLSNPATVFVDRVLRERTVLWDRDFEAAGHLNGLPDSAVAGSYGWFIYTNTTVTAPAASGTFLVNYGNRVPAAPTTHPMSGDQWLFSRNPVWFSVDGNSVRYTLQVQNLSGDVLYTETARLPGPGADGRIRLIPNLYAGFRATGSFPMLPNGTYRWRVRTMNGVGEGAWSALRTITVNTTDGASGPFSIRGDLFYHGRVPDGLMVVEAFTSRDFAGRPVARTTVRMNATKRVPFNLRGLPAGTYFVRAFQDQNGDATLQPHESRGIIDTMASMFYPDAIPVGPSVTGRLLVVRDRDSDADQLPDAWEIWLAGSLTTMGRGAVQGWTDTNGNGLNDYQEYLLGNNPLLGAPATWDAGYVALGANWRRLDWFGDYVPVGGGWYWHGRFGYFFVSGNSTPSQVYLYTPNLGWLFTRKELYPYLYRFSDGAWLWYQRSSSSPRWFLNLNTSLWESH